tara:strand:- start:67 stop:228 length:162 start_codon:yes stop_codon:yes gene_type:complete
MVDKEIKDFTNVTASALADKFLTQQDTDDDIRFSRRSQHHGCGVSLRLHEVRH